MRPRSPRRSSAEASSTVMRLLAAETAELSYAELRKRERPFVLPLDPADPEPVERAAYDAAYKGVTDVLTLYLWRKPAFYPDALGGAGRAVAQFRHRWSARSCACSPSSCSGAAIIGSASCPASSSWCSTRSTGSSPAAPAPRRNGAMCSTTGSTSSTRPSGGGRGSMALPPTAARSTPIYATMVLWAIIGGYVAQRVIEGIFMRRFGGMHIHVWRQIDSRFRLITARRNPNMVILVARAALRTARHRAGAGRAVDADQPDLPRRAARPGERASGARTPDRLLARREPLDGLPARRLAPGRRPLRADR